ncbi:MAG: FG-GAP-like repeat-containing protein [Verrucomicrobia bacterium]|nr:FG-GAP-like repeat-containing protein [Verrucomicrobiota bacterium]
MGVLLALGFLGVAYWSGRPKPYLPGESDPDITSKLTRNRPVDAPIPKFHDATRDAGLGDFRTFQGNRTSQLPEDMGSGAAWGDYDNDGDEDLFVVSAGGPLGIAADQLAPCVLFENKGAGTFRPSAALPETRVRGMAASWADYDHDGFLDLALSSFDELFLFHNEPGPNGRVLARDPGFGEMRGFWTGMAWGDFDNDRDLDLYVCGYVKYVGGGTQREELSAQLGTFVPYSLNPASYEAERNLLFENLGNGGFREVAAALGVENREGRSLGALWHDFDDDGWLDLYVANDISDNVLYRNRKGVFEDGSHSAWVADYRSAMGLTAGDWDRDGDDDLFITHWVAQENALYDNLFRDYNRRPAVEPVGPVPPTSGEAQDSEKPRYELRFMDTADQRGLGQVALPFVGWGTEFADLDNDGWLDLVVVNGSTLEDESKHLKAQQPFLFWNQRGDHFHNLAPESSPWSERHVGRGLAVADYDQDGGLDVVLVHLGEGVQLLRNEMPRGNWLELRLRSLTPDGACAGFADGARVVASVGDVQLRRTVSSVSYLSQSSRVLHLGLGDAVRAERLEVRWQGGGTNVYENLAANARWELREGDTIPRQLGEPNPPGNAVVGEKERVILFWEQHRAAMRALKKDEDPARAIGLFREALRLDPDHEDSLYYLALSLAAHGDRRDALEQLGKLIEVNPKSRRAHQQLGRIRALHAQSNEDLHQAQKDLERAHRINPSETGVLLLLGEVALMLGDLEMAEQRCTQACTSNPRSAGGFFLRSYVSWKRGTESEAVRLLAETKAALGSEWQPAGSTAEGDVKVSLERQDSLLSRFWESWNGATNPGSVFHPLEQFLNRFALE